MQSVRRQGGFTLTELVVASSLLISMMAIVAPLTVRSTQLWRDTRHQQLALDELSNQIEYLSALDSADREKEIASIKPSPEFQQVLPSAELQAETQSDQDGQKLVMTLQWQRRPGQSHTVTLIGWLSLDPSAALKSEENE